MVDVTAKLKSSGFAHSQMIKGYPEAGEVLF